MITEAKWAAKLSAGHRKQAEREKDEKYAGRMKADERIKQSGLKKGAIFWLEDKDFGVKRAYVVEKVDRVKGVVALRGKKNGDVKKIGILNKIFLLKK